MAVDVERDCDAGMSEDCADDLRVDAPAEHQGRVAVPQVMEADRGKLLALEEVPEALVKLCRSQRHGVPVQDRREIHRVGGQDQDAAVAVLGLARRQDFPALFDGAGSLNVDRAVAEVEVCLGDQTEDFPAPQSVPQGEPDRELEGIEPYAVLEELADLIGVEDLVAVLFHSRQVEPVVRIGGDVPPLDGIIERLAERCVCVDCRAVGKSFFTERVREGVEILGREVCDVCFSECGQDVPVNVGLIPADGGRSEPIAGVSVHEAVA